MSIFLSRSSSPFFSFFTQTSSINHPLMKTPTPFKSFSSKVIADFRSDTVTQPTPGMWDAMRSAPLGDDVYEDDPTVHKLERLVADLSKKPAALFCTTATMANQLGLKCVLQSATSVLCSSVAHIYTSETGGVAHHSSAEVIPVNTVPVEWTESWGSPPELEPTGGREELILASILPHLRGPDVHNAVTTTISLENTVAGVIQSLDNIKEIHEFAKKNNSFGSLHMHLDGARLWNASIESGISLSEYCKYFDTISLCLSKGLGTPVGALLVGDEKLIRKARHYRKLFGGGWRQAGLLAAAGIYAIEHHWGEMKADHNRARQFAKELQNLGFSIEKKVDTNMVWISTQPLSHNQSHGHGYKHAQGTHSKSDTAVSKIKLTQLTKFAQERGILFDSWGSDVRTRFVLHHQINDSHIEQFLHLIKLYISQQRSH